MPAGRQLIQRAALELSQLLGLSWLTFLTLLMYFNLLIVTTTLQISFSDFHYLLLTLQLYKIISCLDVTFFSSFMIVFLKRNSTFSFELWLLIWCFLLKYFAWSQTLVLNLAFMILIHVVHEKSQTLKF